MPDTSTGASPAGRSDTDIYLATCNALLDLGSPGDALTAYYLLDHPPSLSLRRALPEPGEGCVAVCRTGAGDHPLVVLRCRHPNLIPRLLALALEPGVKYYFITKPDYRPALDRALAHVGDRMETIIHTPSADLLRAAAAEAVRTLDEGPVKLRPFSRNARPGYRLTTGGVTASSAVVTWQSDRFAEIGVSTAVAYRRRGYARAVTACLAVSLLDLGITPLYIADKLNAPSLALAASLGFRPTGHEEYACSGALPRS